MHETTVAVRLLQDIAIEHFNAEIVGTLLKLTSTMLYIVQIRPHHADTARPALAKVA